MDPYDQSAYRVRLDWGPVGALACAADLTVVVDVLSFTTAVTVAVGRGTRVYPFPWRDERARELARERDAVLAVGRLEAEQVGHSVPSLSPSKLLRGPAHARLVMPSPNGSHIVSALDDAGRRVAAGCLRNASAVAAVAARALADGESVALVAAGERWEADASLRPCLEDHLGAGAIADAIRAAGFTDLLSPEATAAADVFAAARPRLAQTLANCVGGRELTERGYADDVAVAAELDADDLVPVLRDGAFG